jgi:hypothetical protein
MAPSFRFTQVRSHPLSRAALSVWWRFNGPELGRIWKRKALRIKRKESSFNANFHAVNFRDPTLR